MKRLLSLLLIALLLCASLTCASAKTVTGSETFTKSGSLKGVYVSLNTNDSTINGIVWGLSSNGGLSFTSKDGAIIDRIEALVLSNGGRYVNTKVNPGTKRETRTVPNGSTIHIDDINSTSFSTSGSTKISYILADDIVVYYHIEVPETGDAAIPALWLALGLAAAGAIVILTARRRREF